MDRSTKQNSTLPARLLAVVAGILAALAFAWLARELRGVRSEVEAVRSRQQAMSLEHQALDHRGAELEAEIARDRAEAAAMRERLEHQLADREGRIAGLERATTSARRAAAPVVASMVLSAAVRGEAAAALALPAMADFVELRVDLEGDDDYRSFRASLTTEGAHLWTVSGLTAEASEWGSEVAVRLSAKLLGDGVHELTLEGLDDDGAVHILGRHGFTVVRGR